jgi:hypothetical protein
MLYTRAGGEGVRQTGGGGGFIGRSWGKSPTRDNCVSARRIQKDLKGHYQIN